jgi:ribosome maturation factor RimP
MNARPQTGHEARLARETGLSARIGALIEPVIEDMGFRLVRVRLTGQDGCTLQIMAERSDGTMTIDDCTELSRALSAVLDVEDPIPGGYHLEVSSPGIDRPLVRIDDFIRWSGFEAKVETSAPIDGRKRFRGVILGVFDGALRLAVPDAKGERQTFELPIDAIATARLVLSDALIAATLKAQKHAAGSAGAPSKEQETEDANERRNAGQGDR